jgi:hypothetical protein
LSVPTSTAVAACSACAAPFRADKSSSWRRRARAVGRCPCRRAHSTRSTHCHHGSIRDNFRRREWAPAIEASGVPRPARIYDLRSTFASNSLAAGIDVFELARVMGTSIEMIERHYGTLLTGAAAGIATRLAAFEAEQDNDADEGRQEGSE